MLSCKLTTNVHKGMVLVCAAARHSEHTCLASVIMSVSQVLSEYISYTGLNQGTARCIQQPPYHAFTYVCTSVEYYIVGYQHNRSLDDDRPPAVCGQFLRTLVYDSPPFGQLESPAQPITQVAVTKWLATASQLTTAQLEIISEVPLLHADDYEVLLNKAVW